MVGQVEVVVAGEGEQVAAVALHPEPVGPDRLGERAAQAFGFKPCKLFGREVLERSHLKAPLDCPVPSFTRAADWTQAFLEEPAHDHGPRLDRRRGPLHGRVAPRLDPRRYRGAVRASAPGVDVPGAGGAPAVLRPD